MDNGPDLAAHSGSWLAGRVARGEIKANSARTERDRLSSFITMHTGSPVEMLDRKAILEWQATIGALRPATRRSMVGTVSRFLRWLHIEGVIPADLSVHLVKMREPRRTPRGLAHRDVARVIACCPRPHPKYRTAVWLRPATCLMVGCGLRCSDVCNADLDDYDPDARTLFVRGKGGTEDTLPVPIEVAQVIDEYVQFRGDEPGPLFLAVGSKRSASGRLSAKWVSKRTGRLMKAAGVHREAWDGKTAHALRHTAAHDVLDATGDVTLVQELLRHASLATTQRYLPRARLAKLRLALEGRDYLAGLAPTGTDAVAMFADPARSRGSGCSITPGPRLHAGGNDQTDSGVTVVPRRIQIIGPLKGSTLGEATALRGAGSRSACTLQAPDPTEGPG